MTISEVSEKFALSADTLRYYERIGLIPPVQRSPSGIRNYDEQDIKWVEFAKCMRGSGLPIEVLTKYLALSQQGEGTEAARKQLIIEQRELLAERIAQMQQTLERLDVKIARYEKTILLKDRQLRR